MLSDLTPEEFAAFQAGLAYAQALEVRARSVNGISPGLASLPGMMSYTELGEWFGTSAADIRLTERAAFEKLQNNPEAYELFLQAVQANPSL